MYKEFNKKQALKIFRQYSKKKSLRISNHTYFNLNDFVDMTIKFIPGFERKDYIKELYVFCSDSGL
jgi:hypothetical protein